MILVAYDDEGWRGDGSELFARVEIADCGAASNVAERIRGFEHQFCGSHEFGTRGGKGRSEPAGNDCGGDVRYAASENGVDARVPRFR